MKFDNRRFNLDNSVFLFKMNVLSCGVIPSDMCGEEEAIQNERERQTYCGAMNLYTGRFILSPFSAGNGDHTVAFIKHLHSLHTGDPILLIWDNARYHRCAKIREYLHEVNHGLEAKDWKVTCIALAPNAPDQNPVEDIWLKGKNFPRRHFYENKTFEQVKKCFSTSSIIKLSISIR